MIDKQTIERIREYAIGLEHSDDQTVGAEILMLCDAAEALVIAREALTLIESREGSQADFVIARKALDRISQLTEGRNNEK